MKTRTLLLMMAMLLVAVPMLFGKIVEKDKALIVAGNFLNERIANHQVDLSVTSVNLAEITTREFNGQPAFYAFSNNGIGYVIIAADDRLTPVLGYSGTGHYPAQGQSPNFDFVVQDFVNQVEFIRNQPEIQDQDIQVQWNHYLSGNVDLSIKATSDLAPLMTCMWNQDSPYNELCPVDAAGPGGHVYAGCVATAMSMIMYYYRYPLVGIGTHSYYAAGYGTQSVNYGATHYDWDGMMDEITQNSGQSIISVAQLQYQAGVAVNMQYGNDGSSAYNTDVSPAMISHFGFATSTQLAMRTSYTSTTWENLVVGQLDALKPVYYSGVDPTPVTGGGHAFICDGYQVTGGTKLFHFNFGWGGYDNGYFTLAAPLLFTNQVQLIKDMVPQASSYPYGCSNKVITDPNGSFEDGSSLRLNYDPNSSCTWLIDPADSVNNIKLSFISFDVDPSDMLSIYNGADENAPLLGTYSGDTLPPVLNANSGKMFLKFVTDGSAESKGWVAEYHSTFPSYCGTSTLLTAPYGDISDGSGDNNYNNNATCKWKILPPYATDLTLYFNHFDLEANDELSVYSMGTSSTLLATLTGNQIPDPIVSPTGGFLLMFKSNSYYNAPGFDGYYTTSNVGTDKLTGFTGLTLLPNPAKNYTTLKMFNEDNTTLTLAICDMTGKQLFVDHMAAAKGSFEKNIDLSNFNPGMYLVTLSSDKGKVSRKLVVQ